MQLPTEPTDPSRSNPRILLMYGSPKVGKTTKLAELPNCLIIDNEKGTDFIKALKVQVNTVTEWQLLCIELRKQPCRYDYIAVDTISTLDDWAERQATEDYRNSAVGKNFTGSSVLTLPNGSGYLWLRLAFKKLLDALSGITNTLILIAHLKEKVLTMPVTEKEAGQRETSVKDIELTGKLRAIVCAMADAIGYVYRDASQKLMITFKTSENVLCGSRCSHLKGQELPFEWPNIFLKDMAASPVKMGTPSVSLNP